MKSCFLFIPKNVLQLAAEYGDLYSLRFGQQWIVVLNGYKALKEALVTKGDSVIDRPHLPLQDEIAKGLGELQNITCFCRLGQTYMLGFTR